MILFHLILFAIVFLQFCSADPKSCQSPNDKQGVCLKPRDCQAILSMMTMTPRTQEIIAFLKNSNKVCGKKDGVPLVCCESLTLREKFPGPPECGIDGGSDRVFGGNTTKIDEFPWLALLVYYDSCEFVSKL